MYVHVCIRVCVILGLDPFLSIFYFLFPLDSFCKRGLEHLIDLFMFLSLSLSVCVTFFSSFITSVTYVADFLVPKNVIVIPSLA